MSSPCDAAENGRRSGLSDAQISGELEFIWKSNPPPEESWRRKQPARQSPVAEEFLCVNSFTPRLKIA